jgi:putative chitinase
MLLKIGSTGDEVKRLQTKLGLTPDGNFGPVTEEYVKMWQSKHNLTSDGIVGEVTWGTIFPDELQAWDFSPDKLSGHIPDKALSQIHDTAKRFSINTPLRLAHFLAQCAHESGGFTVVFENLNYSADRLKVIFPKYFPGNLADSYANNPVKIASRVYANKIGNGDEASSDGYTYRGRGFIQLTGKNNYSAFAKFIGEDTFNDPDLVATKYPLASAAFYFKNNDLFTICDKGGSADIVTQVTRVVNPGLLGLAERIKYFNDYYNLIK